MSGDRLRALLNAPGIIRAPGAYDTWSARPAEARALEKSFL